MRRGLRGPLSHIYKYMPFGYSTLFLLAHHDFCLPLSSCSSQSSLITLFCRRLLGLYLSRTPCLQESGFLPLLQQPTSGDIKMRDCFPVMAVVFLAQVRLNLALGIFSSSSSFSAGFPCFHRVAITSHCTQLYHPSVQLLFPL